MNTPNISERFYAIDQSLDVIASYLDSDPVLSELLSEFVEQMQNHLPSSQENDLAVCQNALPELLLNTRNFLKEVLHVVQNYRNFDVSGYTSVLNFAVMYHNPHNIELISQEVMQEVNMREKHIQEITKNLENIRQMLSYYLELSDDYDNFAPFSLMIQSISSELKTLKLFQQLLPILSDLIFATKEVRQYLRESLNVKSEMKAFDYALFGAFGSDQLPIFLDKKDPTHEKKLHQKFDNYFAADLKKVITLLSAMLSSEYQDIVKKLQGIDSDTALIDVNAILLETIEALDAIDNTFNILSTPTIIACNENLMRMHQFLIALLYSPMKN